MHSHVTQSQATRNLAAQQTHHDMHPGSGVIPALTHEEIAHRAYDIYVKTGCKKGHCSQNWHQAEHELRTANHRL
jgi:Protein of unknown function (DUF2934)